MLGRVRHAEAAPERHFSRVEQDRAVGQHHEHVVGVRAVLLEKRGRVGLLGRVDDVVRLAVALQEALQADEVCGVGSPDQRRADDALLDEAHAAQDQRAHDALARGRLRQ